MGFLVPAFLVGFLAVAVPVALHLRHRDRDTPHRFPSLMFVDRLPIRTSQRRRITDWPLLLLRALAVTLLVLAFARPLWSRPSAVPTVAATRTVVVLLDRSMSMGHREVWPAALDSARRVISGLSGSDRVALILFDDEAEIAQPLTTDRSLALAALEKARPISAGTRYAGALRAARQLVADAGAGDTPVDVVLVSDLQRSGASGVAGLDLPTSLKVRTIGVSPEGRPNSSVHVVDAHRVMSNGRPALAVNSRVVGRGSPTRQVTLMLRLNGRPSGTRVVSVSGAGETNVAFEPVALPAGLVRGEVTIDGDALAADDTARFALGTDDVVRVLLVAPDDAERDETLYLERALAIGNAPTVRIERVRSAALDEKRLEDASLVLLWDVPPPSGSAGSALTEWASTGGGVVEIVGRRLGRRGPSSELLPATVTGYADRSNDRGGSMGDVRLDHALLSPFRETPAALVAPRFLRHARLEPANGGTVVARFDDGSAAVTERSQGTGRIVMLGTPLDARAGDFPLQPAYLPFVRRLALYASGRDATPLARVSGESWLLPTAVREPIVSAPGGSLLRPTRDARGASVPLREAGHFVLRDGGASSEPVVQLAVNAPTSESDLTPIAGAELLAGIRPASAAAASGAAVATPRDIERRQGFWRYVLGAIAIVLLLEMLMANRGWRGSATPYTTVPSSGGGS